MSSNLANEFVDAVNNGEVTFDVTYAYKDIKLDNRTEKLDLNILRNSQTFQDLDQQGSVLMSARQATDFTKNIERDITSVVIQGLGYIEPEPLLASNLLKVFDVGDTWIKDDAELKSFDERLREQFKLNINPADFQPLRVQKHVIDTLKLTTDTECQ